MKKHLLHLVKLLLFSVAILKLPPAYSSVICAFAAFLFSYTSNEWQHHPEGYQPPLKNFTHSISKYLIKSCTLTQCITEITLDIANAFIISAILAHFNVATQYSYGNAETQATALIAVFLLTFANITLNFTIFGFIYGARGYAVVSAICTFIELQLGRQLVRFMNPGEYIAITGSFPPVEVLVSLLLGTAFAILLFDKRISIKKRIQFFVWTKTTYWPFANIEENILLDDMSLMVWTYRGQFHSRWKNPVLSFQCSCMVDKGGQPQNGPCPFHSAENKKVHKKFLNIQEFRFRGISVYKPYPSSCFPITMDATFFVKTCIEKASNVLSSETTCSRIVELGAGSGFISIHLAVAFPNIKKILAVEVEQESCWACIGNLRRAPITAEWEVQQKYAQQLDPNLDIHPQDVLLCNPPYIIVPQGVPMLDPKSVAVFGTSLMTLALEFVARSRRPLLMNISTTGLPEFYSDCKRLGLETTLLDTFECPLSMLLTKEHWAQLISDKRIDERPSSSWRYWQTLNMFLIQP